MLLDLNLTSTEEGKLMWLLGAALGSVATKCHPRQHQENVNILFIKNKTQSDSFGSYPKTVPSDSHLPI